MTQALKSLTIQLPEEDFLVLERKAQELDVPIELVGRMMIRRSLNIDKSRPLTRENQLALVQFLTEAVPVFQQVAREMNLTEEDVLKMCKRARKELAEEKRMAKHA